MADARNIRVVMGIAVSCGIEGGTMMSCYPLPCKSGWLVLFILVLAWLAAHAQAQMNPRIIGSAYDLESGQLVYTEAHFFHSDAAHHEVLYRSPDGQTFAQKTLNYLNGKTVPSFEMTNDWSGESFKVQWQNQQLIGQYTSRVRDINRGPNPIKLSSKQSLVVDAGFDAFVQKHWASLVAGKTIKFDYVVPTRLRAAPLEMTYLASDEADYKFLITSSLRVLNLFFDPIELRYNPQRQLTEFSGQSNIADKSGRYLSVRIRYQTME